MLYEISFSLGYHGVQDSVLVEATDVEWAEITFEKHFPKKVKYVFAVDEFQHIPLRHKPLEELTIYRNRYPQLEEIDWTGITIDDVMQAVDKAKEVVM